MDRIALRRALHELPEGCRKIFALHEVEGYQHHEIAQLLDCSIGNSKSQLHKAKLKMRGLLFPRPRFADVYRRSGASLVSIKKVIASVILVSPDGSGSGCAPSLQDQFPAGGPKKLDGDSWGIRRTVEENSGSRQEVFEKALMLAARNFVLYLVSEAFECPVSCWWTITPLFAVTCEQSSNSRTAGKYPGRREPGPRPCTRCWNRRPISSFSTIKCLI